MDEVAAVKHERQKIYGPPRENHEGIAAAWTALLQPWHIEIAQGKPLPPHVVALCMAAMKMNRMRRVYHADNFTDIAAYLSFVAEWQPSAPLPASVEGTT
jgi:hypothetical protein